MCVRSTLMTHLFIKGPLKPKEFEPSHSRQERKQRGSTVTANPFCYHDPWTSVHRVPEDVWDNCVRINVFKVSLKLLCESVLTCICYVAMVIMKTITCGIVTSKRPRTFMGSFSESLRSES